MRKAGGTGFPQPLLHLVSLELGKPLEMTADELLSHVISSALHPSSPGPPALPVAPSPVVTAAAPDQLLLFPFPLPVVVPNFLAAWEQQQQRPRPGLLLPWSLQVPLRQVGTLAQHEPREVTQGFGAILPAGDLVGDASPRGLSA